MPPVLPQAEMSRRRLVDVVRKLDSVKRKISEGDIRHLLIFAYILAMQVITSHDLQSDIAWHIEYRLMVFVLYNLPLRD